VEADRSQKVDVVSNDTQIVNVEPSKRLKMDELHQDKVTQTNVAKERKMVRIVTKYEPCVFFITLTPNCFRNSSEGYSHLAPQNFVPEHHLKQV
jgi:hypothetical protein